MGRRQRSVREGLHKIVSSDDTIVALSTPLGRSGIGVVRISGALTKEIGNRFFSATSPLTHRQATVGHWRTSEGELVDEVVVTFFQTPRSYTGEDTLEISAHGNPLILNRIVSIIQSAGARVAAPGEFTLRAVAHGKMDLIQAEAIRDFIEAQTDWQARVALRQIQGSVSRRVAPLKQRLIALIAHLEAGIDFAEDDVDLPDITHAAEVLSSLRATLQEMQGTYSYGRLLREGLQVVIAGRPNVGKSSLFNRLVARDRAIVTEIPGTTRDVLSEYGDLDGIPLRFFDTAGVRETLDVVEQIGVARALETVAEADLVLLVVDGSSKLNEEDRAIQTRVGELPHIVVANKMDLVSEIDPAVEGLKPVRVSARTGAGMDTLREAIGEFLKSNRADSLGDTILTTARQNDTVLRAIAFLAAGSSALSAGVPHEMALLDLYGALSCLNELTGETTTEDILETIFSTFCIGK